MTCPHCNAETSAGDKFCEDRVSTPLAEAPVAYGDGDGGRTAFHRA